MTCTMKATTMGRSAIPRSDRAVHATPRASCLGAVAAVVLCAGCGQPLPIHAVLDCDALPVERMVSSLVRDRVLRAEIDASPWLDAATRARIEMATSVIIDEVALRERDERTGRVQCSASVAIEGMAGDNNSIVRTEGTLSYWASPGQGEGFLVGLGYTDLEGIVATHFRRTAPEPLQRTDAGSW
jgi:hypothetical protein